MVTDSGAPVLNKETGEVEGIFLQGENDFEYNKAQNCWEIRKCDDYTCIGESVFRITGVDYIAPNKESWLTSLIDFF